jgi:hypothetical protein
MLLGCPGPGRLQAAKRLTKHLTCGFFLVEKSVMGMELGDLQLSLPS